jgi:predicted enzyme related to lactoylglutathione lyase
MPTRLDSLVIDAMDPAAQARFWAAVLGWAVTFSEPGEVVVEPAGEAPGLPLVFGTVPETKIVKNRLHLDLASSCLDDQAEIVERAIKLGACPSDIGQGSVPWTVLADPEGNEFCVLEPREYYHGTGAVAGVVTDALDPAGLAAFWSAATSWPVIASVDGFAALRNPSGAGPWIEFVRVKEEKRVKNRLHLDIAPFASDDQAAEVARLIGLGASPADIDPAGNEFCVLSPR